MFHDMPRPIMDRMRELERIDARDRGDGTPHLERMRQIPPETGRFLALLAASAPAGCWLEIGTSAGYSTLWLALAGRETGRRVSTFEILDAKVEIARETFARAGVEDVVDLVHGDALDFVGDAREVGFCFLDVEKDLYPPCYAAVVPNLVAGGILIADNAISHGPVLEPMLDRVQADPRVDATVVPVGKGLLLCRKR